MLGMVLSCIHTSPTQTYVHIYTYLYICVIVNLQNIIDQVDAIIISIFQRKKQRIREFKYFVQSHKVVRLVFKSGPSDGKAYAIYLSLHYSALWLSFQDIYMLKNTHSKFTCKPKISKFSTGFLKHVVYIVKRNDHNRRDSFSASI